MKKTKLYLESSTMRWNCWKCGKPNIFRIDPQGVFTLEGKQMAGPEFFTKALIVTCTRSHMGIPCCGAKRKVKIKKAIFDYIPKKLSDKLNDLHSKSLRKEDKERKKGLVLEIREKLEKEIRAKIKQERSEKKAAKLRKKNKLNKEKRRKK